MGDIKHLTWAEFDDAVAEIGDWIEQLALPPSGLYGLPRGGLPLAVALSHRTGLPLLAAWAPGCVVVDDIIESGATLRPFLYRDCHICVWIDRTSIPLPSNLYAVVSSEHLHFDAVSWLVFPWERAENATVDQLAYLAGRRKLRSAASQ
jgi:hypoxanthine phosphoribosyltransferase